jgi:hypothetical protein
MLGKNAMMNAMRKNAKKNIYAIKSRLSVVLPIQYKLHTESQLTKVVPKCNEYQYIKNKEFVFT